ncbi:MAG: hypothetical protein H0V23_10020 [Nocardioidaceae bacterium]|nr:hypothetical protein [Nocardioidaceae bacterium]
MPTEPPPVTLSQLVHRAVEICDPDGADEDLAELLRRFEDADEPASALVDSIEQRMAETVGMLDPQEEAPALQVASAVVVYLAHRRDEVSDDPDDILRLAVRAEFNGHPPANVANWLDEVGVQY